MKPGPVIKSILVVFLISLASAPVMADMPSFHVDWGVWAAAQLSAQPDLDALSIPSDSLENANEDASSSSFPAFTEVRLPSVDASLVNFRPETACFSIAGLRDFGALSMNSEDFGEPCIPQEQGHALISTPVSPDRPDRSKFGPLIAAGLAALMVAFCRKFIVSKAWNWRQAH
jgi:hypothetical protein